MVHDEPSVIDFGSFTEIHQTIKSNLSYFTNSVYSEEKIMLFPFHES